jgi:hypothetical protein
MCIGFLWENLKGRGDLEDLGIFGRLILKFILKVGWTGFIWLRIGSSGKLL